MREKLDLLAASAELAKLRQYRFPRIQNNGMDRATNPYGLLTYEEVEQRAGQLDADTADYFRARWYNWLSATCVEQIFCSLPGVRAEENQYHHDIDLYVQDRPFDLKMSVWPARYYGEYDHERLLFFLITSASREQRAHTGSRLFLVYRDSNGEHWKGKRDFAAARDVLEAYVASFKQEQLLPFGDALYDLVLIEGSFE